LRQNQLFRGFTERGALVSNYSRFFKKLSKHSWLLIIAFICASMAMQYDTGHITFEGFYLSLPIVFFMVYWTEQTVFLVRMKDCQLTKQDSFKRDLFIISYSFLLAGLLSLLFQFNNADVRGWWPIFLYFNCLVGFIFAFVYSLIALLLLSHKNYLVFFSSLIIFLITLIKFWPHTINFLFIEKMECYYAIIISLLIIHITSVFVYISYKKLHKKTI
jgi:hypothetical protein